MFYLLQAAGHCAADLATGTVVLIGEQLPPWATVSAVTPGPGLSAVSCSGVFGLVTCSATLDAALVAGTSTSSGPTFTLTVTAPADVGATTNYASVSQNGTATPPIPGPSCADPGCASAAVTIIAPYLVTAKAAPDPVTAGTDFNYTVGLGNIGTADVASGTTILVGESLPTGATLVAAIPGAGVSGVSCDGVTGQITCNVTLDGALTTGTTATNGPVFTLTVTAPSVDGTAVNYVSVAPNGVSQPPTPGRSCVGPGCSSATTTVISTALVLAKAAPDPVTAGSDFNYTIGIGNNGTADVADGTVLQMSEQLPTGATLVSTTAGPGVSYVACNGTTGLVTCFVTLDGALPAGTAAASGPVIILTVTAPTTDGVATNYASIAPDGTTTPPTPGPSCTDPGCTSASTTVISTAMVIAKDAPTSVLAGADFNYTINLGNAGTADVASGTVVLIGEELPTGTTLIAAAAGAGVAGVSCNGTTGLITCSVVLDGTLAAGTSTANGPVFTLTVTAPSVDGATTNYVSVAQDSVSAPPTPGALCTDPNCASASTTVTSPALVLAKTAPDPVLAGADFNYTVGVGNAGTADVSNGTVVAIGERLPDGATLVAVTPGTGLSSVQCDGVTGLVVCSATLDGDLAAGTAAVAGPVFSLTVTAPSADGATVNYVSVAPDGVSPPPTPGPNCTDPGCASAATTVTSTLLTLAKAAPDPVVAGTDFNYTVALGNNGTADVADGTVVLVGELLPTGATLVSATAGTGVSAVSCDGATGLVTCSVTLDGALAAGTLATRGPAFTLTVTAPSADGASVNYVSVAPDGTSPPPAPGPTCTGPGCASALTTVISTALVLAKAAPDPVLAGADLNYTINLGNSGTADVADGTVVLIAEQLPVGATLVSASAVSGVSAVSCNGTSGLITCSATLDGALAGGTSTTNGPEIALTVTAPSADGTTTNYVSVAPDGVSPPPTPGPSCTDPGCASASTTVTSPSLVLAKAAPDPVDAGKDFNYTVNLGNVGTADVADGTVVLIAEQLPSGATLVSTTAGPGVSDVQCNGTTGLVACSVTLDGALAAGTAAADGPALTLTVTAPADVGTITNYVAVAPDGVSPPPPPGPACADPGCASAPTTVVAPSLVIAKTAPDPVVAGTNFTYAVSLGNAGTGDLANGTVVVVADQLPPGVTLVSATPGAGVSSVRCDSTSGLVTCSVTLDGALAAGTAP